MATVLVTGANRGIGLALSEAFIARGDTLIAACRKPSPELIALGCRIEALDVCEPSSIQALVERLSGARLDILVNNAGLMAPDDLDRMDFDAINAQLQVNALGPLRVSAALRGNLGRDSKVVIVTSRMGSLSDNNSGRMYGYRMSKAAVNMVGKGLSRDLAPDGIAVLLLHPGFVRTEMTRGRGNWDAPEAAASMIARINELQLGQSGAFWHADGTQLPW